MYIHQAGNRSLSFACSKGHLEIARLLIEKGADLEAKDLVSMISLIPVSLLLHVTVYSCPLANSTFS